MPLAKAPFEKLLKESAKDMRVSGPAARELAGAAEEFSRQLAVEAAELALHAGRRTILDSDVKLARKRSS